jgi:hypothetical protein
VLCWPVVQFPDAIRPRGRRARAASAKRDPQVEEEKPCDPANGTIKDPTDWTTGDEPMTGAQESYLHTLARLAGEQVDDDLTKAEASMKIEGLRETTGLGAVLTKPLRKPPRPAGRAGSSGHPRGGY